MVLSVNSNKAGLFEGICFWKRGGGWGGGGVNLTHSLQI